MFALEWHWIQPSQEKTFLIASFGTLALLLGLILIRNTVVEIRDSLRRSHLENE